VSVGGAVKLSRSLLEHPILSGAVPAHHLRVFLTMLLLANWRSRRWGDGTRDVEIPAGSLVTSAAKMCERCGTSRQQYRNARAFLVRSRLITSATTNRYEIVSIVDWAAYQWEVRKEKPATEPTGNQRTNHRRKSGSL